MITFLEGLLAEAFPTHVVVNVHGIGYHVVIPLSSWDKLPAVGAQIKILTHLVVREDAHLLYGFMSAAERDLFRLLVQHVSGVGPKVALDILSGASVTSFKAFVVGGDVAALARIKGIGKKTAERVVVELRDKVGVAAAWEAASAENAPSPQAVQMNDAIAALITLGYKQVDAHKAVKEATERGGAGIEPEELIKLALQLLR
jgi:Holliday junction DNA helicase RuvA